MKAPDSGEYFWFDKDEFHFPEIKANLENDLIEIPLRTVVRTLTGIKLLAFSKSKYLFFILGRLRSISKLAAEYNQGVQSQSSDFDRYIRYQMAQFLSGIGYQIHAGKQIKVPGLDALIKEVEAVFQDDISYHRTCIKEGSIVFDALQELYTPGNIVRGMTSLGVPAAFRVVQGYFQERKSLFGFEQSFHLTLHYIVSLGHQFTVVEFEVIMSRWVGEANRKISELLYAPANAELLEKFKARGEKYAELGLGEPKYLAHGPGCVFLRGIPSKGQSIHGSRSSTLNSSGRILIDVVMGSSLGHHASHGMDDASHALIEITGRYKRFMNEQKSLGQKVTNPDSIFLLSSIPPQLLHITWPALVGFSFTAKSWCNVLVGGLSNINYNDKAFDQLVLDAKKKRLIKALVRFGGDRFEDIIGGKGGGSIFLLHGPSGVGKTLTAEAIAEVLHKPLYYVTMGELGTDPETMEKRLGDILELCAGWNALTLIDEADVFLEKRATSDVLRNAMVCVMLRLLEYHDGILFLTTNRVTEFDAAFESRVTVALKYESLSEDGRQQVWKNLTSRLNIETKALNFEQLAKYPLNGRQIKNAIRLAYALALDQGVALDQQLVEETVEISNLARIDMKNAEEW
jgi:hypothetical protein